MTLSPALGELVRKVKRRGFEVMATERTAAIEFLYHAVAVKAIQDYL